MVGLFKTKQAKDITKRASDIAKQVDDTLTTTKKNSTKETVVLAYRTNDELRAVCRKEIESLELICTPKVGQFWLNSFCEMSSVLHRTHSF